MKLSLISFGSKMTRDEAIKLLDCSLAELAKKLEVTTAAVAQWADGPLPLLREYQVREKANEIAIAQQLIQRNVLQSGCENNI